MDSRTATGLTGPPTRIPSDAENNRLRLAASRSSASLSTTTGGFRGCTSTTDTSMLTGSTGQSVSVVVSTEATGALKSIGSGTGASSTGDTGHTGGPALAGGVAAGARASYSSTAGPTTRG